MTKPMTDKDDQGAPSCRSTVSRQLSDYAAGRLDPPDRRRIESHLAGCPDCTSWLETYRVLVSVVDRRHPESERLARYALTPELLSEEQRASLGRHLEGCADCRREVELTQAAVARGREASRQTALRRRAAALSPRPSRLALAASVTLLLLTGAALLFRASSGPDNGAASAQTLQGTQVLEAEHEILLAATEIATGADITVRAADVVALGEGFSLAADATLTIEVNPPAP